MEAKATAKYVRVSPRKARLVVDQVRGKDIARAREILRFSERAISEVVEKVLNSAVANAENNHHMRSNNLVVKAAFVTRVPLSSAFARVLRAPLRAFASVPATSPSSLRRERRHKWVRK